MIKKGIFSDLKSETEYDTFGSKIDKDLGMWKLNFVKSDDGGKTIREIGRVSIPIGMAKTVARQILSSDYVEEDKNDWNDYLRKTKMSGPSDLLIKTIGLLEGRSVKVLDLGCGNCVDTEYLLQQGFSAVAVDSSNVSLECIKKLPQEKLFFVNDVIENYLFPKDNFDLVNAQWVLPYIQKEHFQRVFKEILSSMKKGGFFTGQLLGRKDDLAFSNIKTMNFLSKNEIKDLLKSMELFELREEEYDKKRDDGSLRHVHVFHIIFRS